jgi:exopolysaccharide biosynthesis polyprenyl glycosylphosphotransferase
MIDIKDYRDQSTLRRNTAIQPSHCRYAAIKRVFDIFLSGITLLALAPLFLILAVIVKLTSKGPVFYKSERIGYLGKPFTFIKFRSMYTDAEEQLAKLKTENEKDGPIFKIKSDPRITPIGRILRKFSLDELPQLLAVFTGQMSIVGPRPPIQREVEQYDEYARRRLSVKPGITCYWQIMGRSDLSFEEWMELDNRYIDEMSFLTDIKIVVKTPAAVLLGKGAY